MPEARLPAMTALLPEVPAMAADREQLLRSRYDASDARDVDAVPAAMSPRVDWPNGWQGGRLAGRDAVGRYWGALWAELRPNVRPTARDDGTVVVTVHQVIRDRAGTILEVSDVRHVYALDDELVGRRDTEDGLGGGRGDRPT